MSCCLTCSKPKRTKTRSRSCTSGSTSPSNASTPVQSTELFKGHKLVVIEHNGTSYLLHTTKLGKLILTK